MSTETGTSLRVSRIINADRETVFRAWTEPDQLKPGTGCAWSRPREMSTRR
jgi:uncharacterized protein YndB with AHSA1/START domain